MRHVCLQFQPARSPQFELRVYRELRAQFPDAELVEGGDGEERYINVLFDAHTAHEAAARVRALLGTPVIGVAAKRTIIATCEGDRGWDDYVLLHHFDQPGDVLL